MDERTFFEIYAAAFEGAVKNAKPYTIMCSYNKLGEECYSLGKHILCSQMCSETNGALRGL